jgi:CubicO group peptidase (beta-lactamase class C family)
MRSQSSRIFLVCLALLLAVLPLAGETPKPGGAVVSGPLGEKVDQLMSRLEGFGFAGSLLVAKDGKVVLHKGYGLADRERRNPWGAETVFDIGSITKQFTAAAIVKLEMEGKLAVTDPINKYFEGVPADKAGITLHHLLTHSAGLEDGFGGDYEEMPRDELVKAALASKLSWAPGTKYRYSNAGYSLLGAIVEKVSGQPYETFLQEKLFKPAGMTKTGYRVPKWEPGTVARGYNSQGDWGTPLDHAWASEGPWWNLRANGGILSTTGDLYKWHQALEGEKILSKTAKEKIFTPHMPEDEEGSSHYGYGWAIFKTPRNTRLISHNGGNGIFAADFRRYVDEGTVLIIGSNRSDFSSIALLPQVVRLVFGMEHTVPPAVVKADAKTLERFAGNYALPSGDRLVVSVANPGIEGTATPGLAVVPEGAGSFLLLAGGGSQEQGRFAGQEKRLLAGLEGVRQGRFEPIAQVFGVPVPQAAEEMGSQFRRLEERHGKFQRFEVLGTASLGGRPATYVRFHFENGSALSEFGWDGDTVVNVRLHQSAPEGRFFPESSNEFVSFDPRSARVMRIAFEAPEGGTAKVLVVRAPGGDVRLGRVE